MKKHWHYKFIGFDKKGEARNEIMFPVEISVKDHVSEADALFEAKQKLTRKYYFCKEAWECTTCDLQEEQVEVQKKHAELVENVSKQMEKLQENWFTKLFKKKS